MTHSPRDRRLRAAAVAACSAVLLLAGCAADPQVDKAALAKPAHVPVAVPAVDPVPLPDWKEAAYRASGCLTRAGWIAEGLPAGSWDDETVRTSTADVTGDGTAETLVQVVCPAPASSRPEHVVVFGTTGSSPVVLGLLGDDLFHQQAALAVDGPRITLSGPTVAGGDPTCCPTHWGTVTYVWDGARFVVESLVEVPGTSPARPVAPADGEHVGRLLSVGRGEVTVDVVEWFEGDAARAACREDGVTGHETAWCTVYYVRAAGDRPVTVRVSDSASLSYLDLVTMDAVRVGDVAELAGTSWVSENPDAAGYTRFRTEDGVITALESVYTP